jgi:uncharacterized protein YcbX
MGESSEGIGSESGLNPSIANVAALYRHPVKGFTPETCDALTVLPDGRVAGDRVLGFRFANCTAADDEWSKKHEFVALVNTPALARLDVRYDHEHKRLRIMLDGQVLAHEELSETGRKRLAAAVQDYVLGTADNPLTDHPERLPLRLVGDGVTPRFQDNAGGHTTLHGRASLAALAAHMAAPDLNEVRFRSNIAIEGIDAWEEQRWLGRRVRIGSVEFEAVIPKGRCLATHANPHTGVRDLPVMQELMQAYPGQARPFFAIGLQTTSGGGRICVGDRVTLESS